MAILRPGFLLKKGVVKAIQFGLISFCYVWKFYKIVQFADDTQMMSEGGAIFFDQSVSMIESLVCSWTCN